jgi:hypothetical protein
MESHSFTGAVFGPVCVKCGLVRLRNLLTDWAVRHGCDFADHPGWAHAKATLPAEHERRRQS